MRAPLGRVAITAAVTSTLCLMGLAGIGCDKADGNAQADIRLTSSIQESQIQKAKGGSEASLAELAKAAGEKSASPLNRLKAMRMLGQAQLDAAWTLMAAADRNEIEASKLIWEIGQLGLRIQTNNNVIASSRKFDPAALQESLAQAIADVKGGGEKTTWKASDNSAIPTLDATEKEIARLQGEIGKAQEQIKELTAQRVQAVEGADKLGQQSEADKGQKAVDEYKQAAELQKKARELGVQIDAAKVALIPLQQSLATAQGQQKVLMAAIAQFETQRKQIDEQWGETKKQIASLSVASKGILGEAGEGKPGDTIAQKGAALGALLEQIDKDRDAAEKNLAGSINSFTEADSVAEGIVRELTTKMRDEKFANSSQLGAWKMIQDACSPAGFRMQQATAQHALGTLYANKANSLTAREQLGVQLLVVLKEADLAVPKELQFGDLSAGRKDAFAKADSTFKEADGMLTTVAESPLASAETKDAAKVSRIFTLFAWSNICKDSDDTANAKMHLDDAIKEKDDAIQRGNALPNLPEALGPVPVKIPAGSAPAAAPTTAEAAPTTAPAVQ